MQVLSTIHLRGTRAANEVVSGSTGVGDSASILAITVEDNTVSTRGATSVDTALQDGELLVWARDGEVKALQDNKVSIV